MTGIETGRVALVIRGDRAQRNAPGFDNSRLAPVAQALAESGLTPEPAIFAEDMADEVRDQLLSVQGVLVWVDPVTGSDDRSQLDAILREVAAAGVWVSAHPDVIVKMGTKEVLYRTKGLGWRSDTYLYISSDEFDEKFPVRLATGEARVLKQYRGNGGIGVWKVQRAGRQPGVTSASIPGPDALIEVQSARARDEVVEAVTLGEFTARCSKYFSYSGGEGRLVDQPFQPRISEGIIRCYLVKDEVVGFSRQYPAGRSPAELQAAGDGVTPPGRVFGLPAAKTMYGPEEPTFQRLRQSVELDWVPGLQTLVDVDWASLPALWDADFIFGPPNDNGDDSYVLSEINVSAVAPFPEQALKQLARAVSAALLQTTETRATPD